MTGLFGSRRNTVALGLIIAYAVINFVLNIFVVGGSEFIYRLNTVLPVFWGLLAFVLLLGLLQHEREDAVTSGIYRWLSAGLALWVLADIIWGIYAFVFHIQDPYPSWADLFWIVGYPLIFIGLYKRIRSYGVPLKGRDRGLLWGILGLLLLIIVGFILLPTVRDYDPQRLLESILDLAYPIFDATLLVLSLIILFTLERGKFALPWAVITVGFVFNAAADLMLYRALWTGDYYPQGRATILSVLIDSVYNLLYPSLCLGFSMVSRLVSERAGISDQLAAQRSPVRPKLSFELFTDAQDRIISVSENLLYLLKTRDRAQIIGAPLGRVLGIGEGEAQGLRRSLDEQGYVRERQLSVADSVGQRIEAWLTGFPLRDSRGDYNGANFVLQVEAAADFAGPPLTKESALYVNSILEQAGILEKERREIRIRALRSHFQAQLELLYELIASESNHRVARTMEAACQQLARDRGWPIQFGEGKTAVEANSDPAILEEAYPLILAVAREYAVRVLGEELVRTELAKLDGGLPEPIEA